MFFFISNSISFSNFQNDRSATCDCFCDQSPVTASLSQKQAPGENYWTCESLLLNVKKKPVFEAPREDVGWYNAICVGAAALKGQLPVSRNEAISGAIRAKQTIRY